MAPRLSRWIAMTAVAAVLVAVMFLTTGGAPLLYVGYGRVDWDPAPRTQVQRRYEAVQQKLMRVGAAIDSLEFRELTAGELRRTPADPIVFRRSGDRLLPDPLLTAEMGTL
ncbi:MAG TPA: hypothetical protein VG940_01955, partial [Gemmatimonadales bacterium]|nr:hypothetical protein [Gemmatimonadales bacterium]